jgi:hypothetical protein
MWSLLCKGKYCQMKSTEEITQVTYISSNTPRDLWAHPTLDLFAPPLEITPQQAVLFRTPTTFGESFESDDSPQPTSSSQLPDIRIWTISLAVSALEVFAGRRNPAQLAVRCHPVIYQELLVGAGLLKEIGKVVKIHQDHPFDGIVESSMLIKFSDRVRAMVLRAEGIDGRWLCTALELI